MPLPFTGYLLNFQQRGILAYGPSASSVAAWLPSPRLAGPELQLRPGYAFHTRNTYLLPYTIIDDLGQQFDPPESYQWIEAHGDLYPRADAIGHLPTGEVQTVFLKELDLTTLAVFVGGSPAPHHHVALAIEVQPDPTPTAWALATLPFPLPLLARALPTYRIQAQVLETTGPALINRLITSPPPQPNLRAEQVAAWLKH